MFKGVVSGRDIVSECVSVDDFKAFVAMLAQRLQTTVSRLMMYIGRKRELELRSSAVAENDGHFSLITGSKFCSNFWMNVHVVGDDDM